MASQQTPNYKLSRWAGTDRIMMEDFNRDNAAIDAALKGNAEAVAAETAAREAADTALGKKAGLQLIQTLTLATGSDYASAEINIDWSQWAEVYVVFQLEYKGSMKSYNLYFLPNDDYLVRTAYSTHVGAVFHPLFNENLYIEGDNLEVLKLLQETYLGKIKMIYIDPPYNTGNDFVYEDDFAISM